MAYAKEILGLSGGIAGSLGGQYAAVTAAGSAQGDATSVGASMAVVAGADGTKGVILLAAMPGDEVWVFNNSASTLKVYPPTGAAITVVGTGLGSANAAFSQLTYKTTIYKCMTSTQWVANTSA
jgi:hypothetical protein